MELAPVSVNEAIEGILLEEILIKDLVAILLVHISTLVMALRVFQALFQNFLSELIIYGFVLQIA